MSSAIRYGRSTFLVLAVQFFILYKLDRSTYPDTAHAWILLSLILLVIHPLLDVAQIGASWLVRYLKRRDNK